jgi:tRNA (adenine22-N1)-methyltransferase
LQNDSLVKLTPRLKAVADMVLPGQPMADIGSDHGYLPLYLVNQGIVPSAIAVEVRQGPWAKADHQVRLHGLERKIQVRLGDGLKPLQPGEVASAVLAGMGAQTIVKILTESMSIVNGLKRLVLQPMAEIPALREWLYRHHFHLTHEELVREGDRYYVVMAVQAGHRPMPSAIELEVGPLLIANRHPLLKPYLAKTIRQDEQVLLELKNVDTEKAIRQRKLLEKRLEELKEVMTWLSCAKP